MRVSLFSLLCSTILLVTGQSRQNDRITASFDDVELEVIFDSLSVQSGYFFSYNSSILPKGSRYTISADNEPIDQFMSRLLIGTGLKYSFYKDQIILNYEPPQQQVIKKRNFFSISGKVLDENGAPLSNANVFLDGTTIGTSSDIDGNYKLESIPPGFYDIVFSHVGYENAVYQISEYNGGGRIQRHQMELDLGQLEEVEVISNRVTSSQSSWQAFYFTFKEELLGTSSKAQNCVIENPETLNFSFHESDQTLSAFTSDPLIIRNDALGYRISYFLESFRRSDGDLRYRGKIQFRNLEPLSGMERRTWKNNRKESYYGSFNHFKKALLLNELKKEGFRIYQLKDVKEIDLRKSNELSESDIIVYKGDHYELDFDNYIIVEYRKEKESLDFLSDSEYATFLYEDMINEDGILVKNPGNQLSVIRLLKGSLKIDHTGQILDKFALTTYGYWSWERLGDLVPINYDPKSDNL